MKPDPEPEKQTNPVETVSEKKARSTWARLIQKVYEVDPLVCPKCGSAMKVIAVITKPEEIRRIMDHQRRNKAPPFDAAWPEAS